MRAHTEQSPQPTAARADGVAAGGSRHRLPMSLVAAVVLSIAGSLGALLAANSVANNAVDQSRQQFAGSAAEVASTLELAIRREEDLSVGIAGFVAGDPNASNSRFIHWARAVHAFDRYPELQGFGVTKLIPAAQLPAFAAQAERDPIGPLGPGGKFQVIPPGKRAQYCLAPIGQMRSVQLTIPAGYDFCAGAVTVPSRDSGLSSYAPLKIGTTTLLAVQIPVYTQDTIPATVAARRAGFAGWVGMVVAPDVVLARALLNKPGSAVKFRYHADGSDVTFASGQAPRDPQSKVIDLHNGWTVEVFAAATAGGIPANGAALSLLLAGITLSLLLAALVFVLATGRIRALRLVSEKTDELRHQALHDALTGLPNRALIVDRIEQMLARNLRNGTVGAALYVDLDGFKNVNDSLGHEAGDRLLKAVAERLTTTLRGADTIGRMGGDEFVILLDAGSSNAAPELAAERVLQIMRQPIDIGAAMPMVVTASVGIALGAQQEPGELLREADVALYQAKAAGKDCMATFRMDMNTELQRRYELEFDLRGALDADQFRLMYQPIYSLDELNLIGVEALLRWEHPTLGQIQPDEFIPMLEASGQILDVGRWILLRACAQMALWRERGSDLIVSVNVSARQLDRDAIVDHVHDALLASGLDPAALTIEVTETALMNDVDTTADRLRALKALGVDIAIDDFGTGYSSLAYLQRFPVDCLKIDRSFTEAITRSPESDALIHTLVQLGKDLGLRTLAEGVENTGQIDHLRGEHVNEVQGFLLARPLDPEQFEAQLLDASRRVEPGLTGSRG